MKFMSNFILKLLALCAMFIDHIAEVLGWEGWGFFSFDTHFLRYIGRISYPIFAFCIITEWRYCHLGYGLLWLCNWK